MALDPSVAANAANPVNAGGPGSAQNPSCCKPGAACCKPDAACCTPTGQTAGIGLDNFNGAPAPLTNAAGVQGGGPAAASAPVQSQANGFGDILGRLQEMIAQLGKQLGVNFG